MGCGLKTGSCPSSQLGEANEKQPGSRDRVLPHLGSWARVEPKNQSYGTLKAMDSEHVSDKPNRVKYRMGEKVGSCHPKCIPWNTHVLGEVDRYPMKTSSVINYIWEEMGKRSSVGFLIAGILKAFSNLLCKVNVHSVSQRYLGPVTISLSIIRGCRMLQWNNSSNN